jgi:predicted nucleic acid-binding protein
MNWFSFIAMLQLTGVVQMIDILFLFRWTKIKIWKHHYLQARQLRVVRRLGRYDDLEVLAGARSPTHVIQLRRLLGRGELLPMADTDYEDAAAIYRTCRSGGATVRRMFDCLIAT